MKHDIILHKDQLSVMGGKEYTGCVAHMLQELLRTGDHGLQMCIEVLIEDLYELHYGKHPVFIRHRNEYSEVEFGEFKAIKTRKCYKD